MTTIAYQRSTKTIGVDSRNTDNSDATFKCEKIARLKDGRYFLGSGHLATIELTRRWAETNFDPNHAPNYWAFLSTDKADDYDFSCLVISKDGKKVWLIDNEMHPVEVLDDIVAVGSGGGYAKAALMAGAIMEEAISIAIKCDIRSGEPIVIHKIK